MKQLAKFLMRPLKFCKEKYKKWRIKKMRQFRIEEITKTLQIAHAAELANTPGELWPVKRAEHAKQIAAVRDGNITIVDRRSWQFPYLPSSITRIRQPIMKMSPFNIRRYMKSPIPRRAANLIKNGVLSLEWDVVPVDGSIETADPDVKARILAAKNCFNHPNGTDSFQSFMEQNLEDFMSLGAMSIEPQITPDPDRPIKMWSVDTSTIRMYPTWSETDAATEPRYAQMTGLLGERGIVPFMDDELLYLRDNPSNETPFGLGKMEVAFQAVNYFLGVHEASGRAGSDQLHKTWLWWQGGIAPAHLDIVRRHVTNDLEGQMKVSLVSGIVKPEVIEVTPVQEADLLLNWQELLIRIICLSFDMSPAKFLERDVNRSTGEVLEDADFRSAVVPVAIKVAEGFTRFILHRLLGWKDLEFKFLNLDDPDTATKVKIAQQLYSMNATTGNEVRVSMGMPKLASKFSDMTQFELMLLQVEAQGKVQNANADKAMQRNMEMQQYQMSMYQNQPSNNDQQDQQGAALVKLPMAGCMLNAMQVARMSPKVLQAAINRGMITPDVSMLCEQMETQEPGILDTISDELKEYLESLREEQLQELKDNKAEFTQQDVKDQAKKYKQFQHKQTDVERVANATKSGMPKSRIGQQVEAPRLPAKKLSNNRNSKVVRQ